MATLKLPNGVKLTYPKNWVLKARYGSQPGQDWSIVLQNKESTLHVFQQTIGGRTSPVFSADGLEVEYVGRSTGRSSGCTSKSRN